MGEYSCESLTEYGEITNHKDAFVLRIMTSLSDKGRRDPIEMQHVHPYPPAFLQHQFVTRVLSHKPEIVLPQTPFK